MDAVRELLSRYVCRESRLAVAVSGGMDSMCLLHFLLDLDFVERENIIVVNVEHGIRGESSKRDSEFVKGFALRHGLRLKAFSFDVLKRLEQSGLSIEHEARLVRREAYFSVADKVDFILTAHHASDSAETVLMNLFRGSGLNGLKGISTFADLNFEGRTYKNKLFRPLINCTREQIEAYAKTNKVDFVVDVTNLESDYSRNFLRNELMPLIKKRWGGAENAINALSCEVLGTLNIIDSKLDSGLIAVKDNEVSIFDEALGSPYASYYVFKALKSLGVYENFERKHIELVVDLLNKGINGKVDLPKDITAYRDQHCVTLKINEDLNVKGDTNKRVEFALGTIKILNREIKSSIESLDSISFDEGRELERALFLDLDKIPKGAVFRFRQDGDIFKPFKGGTKKLKDFFIDRKIPSRLRDSIPLLAFNERVLAVLNVEISDEVSIDEKSKNVIKIKFI